LASITLEHLAHSYHSDISAEDNFALKEVNHVWQDGQAYALLGPSGCGKTTLLNIISGLITPTKGRVLFDGQDVTMATTSDRNIAQVFQFPVVYDTMTVGQNLAFPLRNRGMKSTDISDRVSRVAQMIGLEAELHKKARGLTSDLKQKISLGRGMVRDDVNAILFDEPLTVIDPHLKWELRTQLKSLHQEFEHTMIYVTHDQTEALTFADKVVVMHDGQVVQIGTPEQLFETPEHRFVGYFIGSPGMNFFPVSVDGNIAQTHGETISLAGHYGKPTGDVALGIRPEFITLCKEGGLPVHVNHIRDIGRHKLINATLFGAPLNIIAGENFEIEADMTQARFNTDKISIFCDDWRMEAIQSSPDKGGTS